MFCWLFFNFVLKLKSQLLTDSGDELCWLLPAPFQAAAYHPPPVSPFAFLLFVYWNFAWRSAPCSSPILWSAYNTTPPLLHVPFQFLVYYSGFWGEWLWNRESVCPGGYAGLSKVWLGEYHMMLGAHLLVCWVSPKQVWSQCLEVREPSCFLSVTWHGEALYGLGIQSVKFWFFLVLFSCQVWLQYLSKIFDLWSSHCLLLHSSHHLWSSKMIIWLFDFSLLQPTVFFPCSLL
jgi:hypothetical protein